MYGAPGPASSQGVRGSCLPLETCGTSSPEVCRFADQVWIGPGNRRFRWFADWTGRDPSEYRGADATFAAPEVCELLEAERFLCAIRIIANRLLWECIAHLLGRPVGRIPDVLPMSVTARNQLRNLG